MRPDVASVWPFHFTANLAGSTPVKNNYTIFIHKTQGVNQTEFRLFSMGTYYTVAEAAALLRLSEKSIRARITAGKLPAEKVQAGRVREWHIDAAAVDAWKAARPPLPPVPAEVPVVSPPEVPAELPVELAELASRIARVEGVLSGQLVAELQARAQETTAALTAVQAELAQVRQELVGNRDQARQREEALLRQITELARPWWAHWFRRNRGG